MHFQTSRNRVNSRRVRTHEIERTQEMLFADWAPNIIQSNFCAQSGASIRLTIWNSGPVRVGTQGLCHLCLKTLVAPFLPARLTAPGSPRMEEGKWVWKREWVTPRMPGWYRYAYEGYWPYRGVGSMCFSAKIGIVDIHSSEYVWIACIQTFLYFSFRCFGKHRRARERKTDNVCFLLPPPLPLCAGGQ